MPEQKKTNTSLLYRLKQFQNKPAGIALLTLFWSVFITGIVYLITTTQILRVGWRIVQAPMMLAWNILPVLLCILLLFFATRKFFFSVSATDRGWRFAPGYYEMRDILELWYMVS